MVAELKEKQEKQVIPASREETISRLDVIEQRILEMQNKPAISENTVQEILNQIACIKKRQSGNQKQDLDDIKGMIVTSHRYFKEKLKELFPTDTRQQEKVEAVSLYDKPKPDNSISATEVLSFFSRNNYRYCFVNPECSFYGTVATVTGQ